MTGILAVCFCCYLSNTIRFGCLLSLLIGTFAFPSDRNKMGSSLLRFLGLLFLVLTVQEYISVEVFSFFQSPAFCPAQGWIPCPAVFSCVMWGAAVWQGCLSVQACSLPDSRRPFHLSCYRSIPIYSSFSKFLTTNCWASGRAYFGIGIRAPEQAVPPPSAEGNTSP